MASFVTPRPVPQFHFVNTFSTKKVSPSILCMYFVDVDLTVLCGRIEGCPVRGKGRLRHRLFRPTTAVPDQERPTPSLSNPTRTQHWLAAPTTTSPKRPPTLTSASMLSATSARAPSATSSGCVARKTASCTPSSGRGCPTKATVIARRSWRRCARWSHCPTIPTAFASTRRGRRTSICTFNWSCARPASVRSRKRSTNYPSQPYGTTWLTCYW